MQPLPQEFLVELAKRYELSSEQEEAFVTRFEGNKSEQEVAEALSISSSALTSRMSGVYNKFSIRGRGPGKVRRLHDLLLKEYQKSHSSSVISNKENEIDELVQEVRDRIRPLIQEKCGTMRVLDMNQPIELGSIYTHVNILEKISGRSRRELAELMREVSPEAFERFSLGDVQEPRIPGLEAVEKYSKLMIWGKPGTGKTTFLKHLAIECISDNFQSHRVPLFITLKEFAETDGQPKLLTFIDHLIHIPVRAFRETPQPNSTLIQQILDNGHALIMLDGLDEVREIDISRVLRQIQQFSEHYSRNTFIITCRIAACEYTFQQFTDVEIADFDDKQIAYFANQWFSRKRKEGKAEGFLKKLNANPRIHELAAKPLLLSLLCLIFEERGDFPAKRSSIYEQGIELLLREWNPHERERCLFYRELSPDHRKLLLQHIAIQTFEKGNHFFHQQEVEKLIKEYIESLGCFTPRELIKLDTKLTLATIEAQHGLLIERANGIYSFSHLTFQEYFVAQWFVKNQDWETLAQNTYKPRWQEVFLLTTEIVKNSDELLLLLNQAISLKVAEHSKLQKLLQMIFEWFPDADSLHKLPNFKDSSVADRLEWLPIIRSICLESLIEYIHTIPSALKLNDLTEEISFPHALELSKTYQHYKTFELSIALENELKYILISELDAIQRSSVIKDLLELMKPIKEPLSVISQTINDITNLKALIRWWDINGKTWNSSFRSFMRVNKVSLQELELDRDEVALLLKYYDANKFLAKCLRTSQSINNVSQDMRQKIEDTLLLPIAEIEKRKSHPLVQGE